jgi:hypothetical protein
MTGRDTSRGTSSAARRTRWLTGGMAAALGLLAATPLMAGRPLAVDDANTNDAGSGHLELWAVRSAGSTLLNVSPAYAPVNGLEFAAAHGRENGTGISATALQLKWRITDSRDDGCNLGLSLGVAKASPGGGRSSFANGLVTCNGLAQGSLHVNLGSVKPQGGSAVSTWGLAYERAFGGVTPHIEWFGSEGARPTLQLGLRGDIAKGWQLDGSLGRGDGDTVYTLGMKRSF